MVLLPLVSSYSLILRWKNSGDQKKCPYEVDSFFLTWYICVLTKKLRDVLQEREGTSLNYFKVFFDYIEQFSRSVSVCLSLSQSVSVCLGLSRTVSDCLGLSWTILNFLGLFRTILDYIGLIWTILDYLGLSWTILDYLGLSGTI